jgi:hypothetical protein
MLDGIHQFIYDKTHDISCQVLSYIRDGIYDPPEFILDFYLCLGLSSPFTPNWIILQFIHNLHYHALHHTIRYAAIYSDFMIILHLTLTMLSLFIPTPSTIYDIDSNRLELQPVKFGPLSRFLLALLLTIQRLLLLISTIPNIPFMGLICYFMTIVAETQIVFLICGVEDTVEEEDDLWVWGCDERGENRELAPLRKLEFEVTSICTVEGKGDYYKREEVERDWGA